MQDLLELFAKAAQLAAQLQVIVPELEKNYADLKDALSSNDKDQIRQRMDALHAQTNNLAADLDALRDPAATKTGSTKRA